MKVSDFSDVIVDAASRRTGGSKSSKSRPAYAVGLASFGSLGLVGDPLYHISGMVTCAAANAADTISTYRICKRVEDPRFCEYGLDRHFRETSSSVLSHPTRRDLINIPQMMFDGVLALMSGAFPPLGYYFAAQAPGACKTNNAVRKEIDESFRIGDDIKRMIESGCGEDDIKSFLKK